MSDDLKKRLRRTVTEQDTEGEKYEVPYNLDGPDAADRIEELEAEVGRLKTQCKGLAQSAMNNGQALIIAEAKLAKAVEALVVIDALDPAGLIEGCSQSALRGLVLRMGAIARTALAALKGETDARPD
jgi:hypothetical protein